MKAKERLKGVTKAWLARQDPRLMKLEKQLGVGLLISAGTQARTLTPAPGLRATMPMMRQRPSPAQRLVLAAWKGSSKGKFARVASDASVEDTLVDEPPGEADDTSAPAQEKGGKAAFKGAPVVAAKGSKGKSGQASDAKGKKGGGDETAWKGAAKGKAGGAAKAAGKDVEREAWSVRSER